MEAVLEAPLLCVFVVFFLRGMNWEDGTASVWSSWTDINIFSSLALHEMEKGHIKVFD